MENEICKDFLTDLALRFIMDLEDLTLENLKVKSEFTFGDSPSVNIVVLNKNYDNRSFTFYAFREEETIESRYNEVIEAIKKDDFNLIVKLSGT